MIIPMSSFGCASLSTSLVHLCDFGGRKGRYITSKKKPNYIISIIIVFILVLYYYCIHIIVFVFDFVIVVVCLVQ